MIRFALFAALVMTSLASALADAAPVTYSANLAGANENPATPSAGTGSTVVIYDAAAHTLRVVVQFAGLTGTTTASHIHCCAAPPGNAGVATTTPTFTAFPLGVTSGTYDRTFDLTAAGSWNPAFITANGGTPASAEAVLAAGLAAGQAYLNVHTNVFPGGEVRGFLVLAPELSSSPVPALSDGALIALALALASFALASLRRR
jgi:hypothetical protein